MKYGIIFLIGGLAAFASLRRFMKPGQERRPTVGTLSERWLLAKRGDEQ